MPITLDPNVERAMVELLIAYNTQSDTLDDFYTRLVDFYLLGYDEGMIDGGDDAIEENDIAKKD